MGSAFVAKEVSPGCDGGTANHVGDSGRGNARRQGRISAHGGYLCDARQALLLLDQHSDKRLKDSSDCWLLSRARASTFRLIALRTESRSLIMRFALFSCLLLCLAYLAGANDVSADPNGS